jgi:hypothetical protein
VICSRALVAAYRAWLIGAPVLVGLLWWRRRPAGPYGPLLAALGLAAATLALESPDRPLVFTLGILGEGAYFTLVLFVCVAFPSGRLRGTAERALIGVWIAGTVVYAASHALLGNPLVSGAGALVPCDPRCPRNPLAVADAVRRGRVVLGLRRRRRLRARVEAGHGPREPQQPRRRARRDARHRDRAGARHPRHRALRDLILRT